MTTNQHTIPSVEPTVADYLKAAEEVVCLLSNHLSPKKERAVRKALASALERLEVGTLPSNVIRIRGHRYDPQGPERLRLAAAFRQIAAPVLS